MPAPAIRTSHFALIPATVTLLELELEGSSRLAEALQARIPHGWPPGEYDADAMRFMLGELKQRGTAVEGWLAYYVVTHGADGRRDLVANAGYFGPPTKGMIEIGFSVVEEWRRRGIATECVTALIDHAGKRADVRVIARTRRDNIAAAGVLDRCRFREIEGPDEGLRYFERAARLQ